MEIQFYYWFVLAVGFRLMEFFRIGKLSMAVAFAAAMQGIMPTCSRNWPGAGRSGALAC